MQSKFALQIECFLFVLCGKSKNIPGRNKKIPEDFVGKKGFGEGNYGIRKGYAAGGVTGFKGSVSDSSHPPTDGAKLTVAPFDVKAKV